ncbi:hypothetical protein [Slackia equolifaciens]
MWYHVVFLNPSFTAASGTGTELWLIAISMHFVALATLTFLPRACFPLSEHRIVLVVATCCMTAGCVLLFAGIAPIGLPRSSALSAILIGFGSSIFPSLWGEALARLQGYDVQRKILAIAALLALAGCIIIREAPFNIGLAFISLLPFASLAVTIASLRLSPSGVAKVPPRESQTARLPMPASVLACIVAFSLPLSYYKTWAPDGTWLPVFGISIVLLAAIFTLDAVCQKKIQSITVIPQAFIFIIPDTEEVTSSNLVTPTTNSQVEGCELSACFLIATITATISPPKSEY